MATFLIDYKNDVLFYSKLVKADSKGDAYAKGSKFIQPNYKIDSIIDLSKPFTEEKTVNF